jgi:DNA-binding IclR family transcriptional regulator
VETAYDVLEAVQAGPGSVALKTVAARAGLSASAAHNYLTSLVRTGMIETDGRGRYRLGASLASLGISALRDVDTFEVVRAGALSLWDETARGVAVTIWTDPGPVITYKREGFPRGPFDLRVGPVPALHTAAGNVFLTYLDIRATLPVVEHELGVEGRSKRGARKRIRMISDDVRARGYVARDVPGLPGYGALSAPIWDGNDHPSYALSIVGPTKELDTNPGGAHVPELLRTVRRLSQQLGAPPKFEEDRP